MEEALSLLPSQCVRAHERIVQRALAKLQRYGPQVTPIVLEDTGRLHVEALKMVRHLARDALEPAKMQRQLIGELQAIMFTESMQSQRAARGAVRA